MNTNRIINIGAFAVLTLLWLGVGAALIFNPTLLDTVWSTFLSWNIVLQLIVGLLFLPVVAGLWIWESSLPLLARLILVIGLGVGTLYMFFPRGVGQAKVSHEKPIQT